MTIFDEAIRLAISAHSGQTRKTDKTPYILHPMEVACIASSVSDDLDLLTAAVLHDAVEDTAVSVDEIAAKFGDRVAQIVATETEDKQDGRPPEETWKARKEDSLQRLKNCDDRLVKILWLADKLANLRSLHRALVKDGEAAWGYFHQSDPKEHYWYYRSVADLLKNDLGGSPAWDELDALVERVFAGRI